MKEQNKTKMPDPIRTEGQLEAAFVNSEHKIRLNGHLARELNRYFKLQKVINIFSVVGVIIIVVIAREIYGYEGSEYIFLPIPILCFLLPWLLFRRNMFYIISKKYKRIYVFISSGDMEMNEESRIDILRRAKRTKVQKILWG